MAQDEMELVGVALQRPHELHRIAALGEDAVERPVERDEVAVEGGADHVVDLHRRAVAHHRCGILEGDRLRLVADLVEHELVDLAAGLAAVAAQPLDDPLQRILFHGEAVRLGRALDQPLAGLPRNRGSRARRPGVSSVSASARRLERGVRLPPSSTMSASPAPAATRFSSAVADSSPAGRTRTTLRPPIRDIAENSSARRAGSPFSTSPAISTTRNGSLRSSHTVSRELRRPLGDQAVVVAVDDDAADPGDPAS